MEKLVLTGADPCLLCQKVLWANCPNIEAELKSMTILQLVSLHATYLMRQNKSGDLLSFIFYPEEYLLVSLESNYRYL